jgi:beta-lactamase superfamily II metal-dependent hydrolase
MSSAAITIRMYNVGFGDCFLVKIPHNSGTLKILFDCGSIKAGPRPMAEVVKDVVKEVTEPDGKARIDVVVATHRHKDHVSGFANALWKSVEVKEVWLPWTEDPNDPEARKIRDTQSKLAALLTSNTEKARAQLTATSPPALAARLDAMADIALNALTNEVEMQTLHEGFLGKPLRRFLPTDKTADAIFQTHALPDVLIHILGPSKDEDVIRDMDPPAGQSYLQLYEGGANPTASVPDPFREDWWPEVEPPQTAPLLSANDRARIRNVNSEFDFNVAVALDKAVNGTSLMIILRVADQWLLFPGDAQWGTWQAALASTRWKPLLEKITFYKIGHHGSHNATPVEFVEKTVGNNFWAMASTHHVSQWPSIPKEELLAALGKKTTKIARSDRESEAPTSDFQVVANHYIETQIPL